MALPSKDFTPITGVRTQPDAPVDTTLMTNLADNDVHVNERMGTPTGGGTPSLNHAHLGLGVDGTVAIAGTTGGISIAVGLFQGPGSHYATNLARFNPEFMLLGPGERVSTGGFQLKTKDDISSFSTDLFSGTKTNTGISGLRLGGARINDVSAFVGGPHIGLLLKSNSQLTSPFVKYGTYDGIGPSTPQSITGIEFLPSVVLVWRTINTTTSKPVIRTIGMTGTNSKQTTGEFLTTQGITSLDADGFTVGTDNQVNGNNIQYSFLALRSGSDSGEAIQVDSYVGDDVDERILINQAVPTFGPHFVWIISTSVGSSTRPLVSVSIEMNIIPNVIDFLEDGITLTDANAVNNLDELYDVIWFLGGIRP